MTTLPPFRLQVAPPCAPTVPDLDRQGGFNYDQEKGGYVHEWTSLPEFEAWRRQEELAYSIELILSRTDTGKHFTHKRTYNCSRQHTGGAKQYQKKHLDWNWKIDSKKTGCRCQVTIKLYPDTATVLGRYDAEHDHEVGLVNLAYTWMSGTAREKIYVMLTQKIDHSEIVCQRSYLSLQ